jgi:uncharacterized protein YjlB
MKTPRKIYLERGSDVPNSKLPVLLFRNVLAPQSGDKAGRFRQGFLKNGWTGLWTDTIYDYTASSQMHMKSSALRRGA